MKAYRKGILFAVLFVFIAGTAMAGETLKQFGDIQGRTYHQDIYDSKACDSCHNNKTPVAFPADDACLKCHDLEELVTSTARTGEEKWQNPHNNLHYGKEVPCMECHGEHEARKPLCQGCHAFKYPKFKQ